MFDAAMLGRRLKAMREKRGLSQQAVAEGLGIPRTALTKIETATRSVSTLELARFADMFGIAPASLISDQGETREELFATLARVLPEFERSGPLGGVVRRMVSLCQEGVALKTLLGQRHKPDIPSYDVAVGTTAEAIWQAETVAAAERRRLGLGNAPVSNLAKLFSAEGIWIASAELPDDLSGLFINHPDVGQAILVNNGHREVRRRFAFAHEYAHALFDRADVVAVTQRSNASALMEKRANAFAAAFLMPGDGVIEQLRQLDKGHPSKLSQAIFDVANNSMSDTEVRPAAGSQIITFQDVAFIARHFMVSYEAAAWRLRSLNRLSHTEAQGLVALRDVGRHYLKLLDFGEVVDDSVRDAPRPSWEPEEELRSQLIRLAMEAYRRQDISADRLRAFAAMLALPVDELVALAEAARVAQ
jgi:Zn-dependent peptidase ImmA (M78 family)/transcriptional regulator with XRE-family HTH domain